MSKTSEVIELLFNAEYRGKAEVRALKRDISQLSTSFGTGLTAVSGFTLALGAMELAAIASSIGLAKAGAEAAGGFGAGFNEISTLITDVDADLGLFKNQIKDYASGSTASIDDINLSIYSAISAGIDYKKSIEFLTIAEKLSVGGKATLSEAVGVLTGTLSAYGEETDQAGRYSDILFNTVKNGVTTIPELASGLGKVSGTAAGMGITFEQVAATTATLTKGGIATSEAMTVLKAIIAGIIKPTKEAAETADDLGISLGVNALKSKGLAGVLEEMAVKTGGSEEKISKLFGSTEALNGALILTSTKGLKTFKSDLDAMNSSTGATETAFTNMAENAALIKQTLQNNIQLTLIGIGEPILDEFKDIDKAISDIFVSIRGSLEGDGALSGVIDSVEGLAGTVAGIIRNMANNMDEALDLANVSGFSNAFDRINDSLKGLDLETPEGLAAIITMLGNSFKGLTEFTISASEVLKGMLEVFGGIGSYLPDLDGNFASLAGNVAGWAIALSTASLVFGPFIALLKTIKNMGGIAGAVGSSSTIAGIAGSVSKLGTAGKAFTLAFFAEDLFNIGKSGGGAIVQIADNITGITEAMYGATKVTPVLQKAMDDYSASIGKTSVTMVEYNKAMKEKHRGDLEGVSSLDRNSLAHESNAIAIKKSYTEEEKLRAARAVATFSIDEATGKVIENKEAYDELIENQELLVYLKKEHATEINKEVEALQKLSQKSKLSAKDLKTLGAASDDVKNRVKALNSIKPVFDFQTAKVEAESKEVQAIMGALGSSATAAGNTVGDAFKLMSSDNYADLDFSTQWDVRDSMTEMAESQGTLAKAQAAVAEAKAKYIESQADRMMSSDALISIDGTSLEPHLEAFMFEILKTIQVKVAADQADFLLGVPK